MRDAVRASIFVLAICCAECAPAQLYRPVANNNMWDSYLLRDDDEYHLFYLQNENYPRVDPDRPSWLLASVGRAVSRDLINWETLPPLNFRSYGNQFDDAERMFIGQMPVKWRDRYYLFFDPRPRTAGAGSPTRLLSSPDLKTWREETREPVLRITPPHYGGSDWRDLFLSYDATEELWHGYLCAHTADREPRPQALTDMTIVVWVDGPDVQLNAGAICVSFAEPSAEGEGAAFETLALDADRQWVIHSDKRRKKADSVRTGPRGKATVAAVFEGTDVRLYRDGELIATYRGSELAAREILNVTLGRVRSRQDEATPNHFVGAIDEARIYDRAFSPQELRSLQPSNVDGQPQPIAAWTFDDATVADKMGAYPMGEMNYGAKIEDGRLILDGVNDHFYQPGLPSMPGMACIAHVTSRDLLEWGYHGPIFASKAFAYMECPDYFQMGDWHYLLFSTVRSRKDTSGRKDASGTYYVMSRKRDGPYHLPDEPLLFGSGRGRMDNYVGRQIEFDDDRLLYYHTVHGNIQDCIAKPATWGAPKRIVQREDGTLSLAYWPQLDKLATNVLYEAPKKLDLTQTLGNSVWKQADKMTLGATTGDAPAILWQPVDATDLMVTAKVRALRGTAGIVWRCSETEGRGLLLDATTATMSAIKLDGDSILAERVDDYTAQETTHERHVRIMLRSHRADIYIDDRWTFSTSVIDAPRSGRLGLFVGDGDVSFRDLRVVRLSPLQTPTLP